MTDLSELFARDPLTYTKEAAELETVISEMRKKRAQFNSGALKAGSTKPLTEKQKQVLSLKEKIGGGLDL
jgi:hypothetical protein